MSLLSMLSPLAIVRQLRQANEASTFERLGRSRHVADLRLIFSITVIIMVLASMCTLLFCFEHEIMTNWVADTGKRTGWTWARYAFAAVSDSGVVIGAVGAMGCGVLAWTYQTGSARLGVVDLFACEIGTLCRVAAVTEMVQRYIDRFGNGPQAMAVSDNHRAPVLTDRFNSQESYFPVFNSGVKDLQVLEEDVVKHITAFYTYMKVMRDSLRKLADIPVSVAGAPDTDMWHTAICNVIYMQFLGLESARAAIGDLVEFEPKQAEDIATILLSELIAYGFLRVQFTDSLHQRLLRSREAGYHSEYGSLRDKVSHATGRQWQKAQDLMVELTERYHEVFSGAAR